MALAAIAVPLYVCTTVPGDGSDELEREPESPLPDSVGWVAAFAAPVEAAAGFVRVVCGFDVIGFDVTGFIADPFNVTAFDVFAFNAAALGTAALEVPAFAAGGLVSVGRWASATFETACSCNGLSNQTDREGD